MITIKINAKTGTGTDWEINEDFFTRTTFPMASRSRDIISYDISDTVKLWLAENNIECTYSYTLLRYTIFNGMWTIDGVEFHFEKEEHAIFFKLKWC